MRTLRLRQLLGALLGALLFVGVALLLGGCAGRGSYHDHRPRVVCYRTTNTKWSVKTTCYTTNVHPHPHGF